MSEKKTRAPKKLTVIEIQRQFDLLSLPEKLSVLQHAEAGIAKEKANLEEQIKLIGNKA